MLEAFLFLQFTSIIPKFVHQYLFSPLLDPGIRDKADKHQTQSCVLGYPLPQRTPISHRILKVSEILSAPQATYLLLEAQLFLEVIAESL